jgi:sugar O-acyltransferase (sialic acid O-acetyltransferase NeuD family)
MKREVAIYGAGGFAREVAWLIQACNQKADLYEIVCYVNDNVQGAERTLNGIPVMDLRLARKNFPGAKIVVGVGTPKTREILVGKAALAGFDFETIIHPSVERSNWMEIGAGTVICAGNILTVNIKLGNHVQINLGCTVGHDVIMGDYATLAPGVHVSGYVHLGRRVYVGTGAVIINGTKSDPLVIGDDVIIGAGACVNKPVPKGLTVVGVPAKPV